MSEPIWNTVEVRIVCIAEGIEANLESQPQNIFKVFSYEQLMNKQIEETYRMNEMPSQLPNCGFAMTSWMEQ